MAPPRPAYDVDWIIATGSNIHLANHREWFVTFTEFVDFKTQTTDGVELLGIGDVEVDIKISATRRGKSSHRKLLLKDVVYAPSSSCNIVGWPIVEVQHYGVQFESGGGRLTKPTTGGCAGLLDHVTLWKLWLVGQPKGRTCLDPRKSYSVNANWSSEERARWEAHKETRSQQSAQGGAEEHKLVKNDHDNSPYTAAEKEWLKQHYGGEFKFLQSFGLKIWNEEDRTEGRSIVRSFMADEDSENDDYDQPFHSYESDEDEDYADRFMREVEEEPLSHVGDYAFSATQLDFIQKHYGHSGNFLLSYGLKPWNSEDCEEGAMILSDDVQ